MLGKILIIFGGLISIVLGLIGLVHWWTYFLKALMAVVPIFLVFLGIIFVIFGYLELKDQLSKKEEQKQ